MQQIFRYKESGVIGIEVLRSSRDPHLVRMSTTVAEIRHSFDAFQTERG